MTDMRRQDEAPVPGPVDASPTPPPPSPGPVDDRPSYETGGLRLGLLIAAVVLAGLVWGWPVLVMILGIVFTIFLHELGHYLTAKWSGMKVTEFFFGFGPKIWSFQRGETEYGFKVIPAGAYVRIIGMNNLDEVDPADEPRTYRQQSFPKRLLVVSAGSLSHLLQAFVIGVVLLGVVGIPGGSVTDPRPDAWTVGQVVEDSAAEQAGIESGDRILGVGERPASDFGTLSEALATYDVGDEVAFTIDRDGRERTIDATIGARPEDEASAESAAGTPFLGVGTEGDYSADPVGIGEAITQTPGEMWNITTASVGALGRFFSPSGLSDFAGDVGNAREDRPATTGGNAQASDEGRNPEGFISILGLIQIGSHDVEYRTAFILTLFLQVNLLLGLLNMLPLPPLDGGHAAVAIYERVRSRAGRRYHADFSKLLPLTYAVVLVLMVIGVTTLYLDAVDPIQL
jgi:membrane-associated protease RseP (regulator of RpoE activity)